MTRPPSKPPAKADEAPARTLRVETQIEEIEDRAGAAELLRRILRAQARTAQRLERDRQHDDAA